MKRNFFLLCFTLLQNSIELDEFDRFLDAIYVVFMEIYDSTVVTNCFEILVSALSERNVEIDEDELGKPESEENCKPILIPNPTSPSKPLKELSQFTKYYSDFISELNEKATNHSKSCQTNPLNKCYQPALFNIIYEYLYIMPMWSGVVVRLWQKLYPEQFPPFTRYSNNPVENWFGQLKNRFSYLFQILF